MKIVQSPNNCRFLHLVMYNNCRLSVRPPCKGIKPCKFAKYVRDESRLPRSFLAFILQSCALCVLVLVSLCVRIIAREHRNLNSFETTTTIMTTVYYTHVSPSPDFSPRNPPGCDRAGGLAESRRIQNMALMPSIPQCKKNLARRREEKEREREMQRF